MIAHANPFTMNKLTVDLQNCYGIKKLAHLFDFTQWKAFAIYAPNGSMKSSLAETFKNIADGEQPRDRIFPKRKTVCKIVNENGDQLPPESVLVLRPYDEEFSHNEQTSTLLVNSTLRKQFEKLLADLNASKQGFLGLMKDQSGSKKALSSEITLAFMPSDSGDDFFLALARAQLELPDMKTAPYADVVYDAIFDDKVLAAINDPNFKEAIQSYITRYNELLQASTYFKKGVFEYYNARQIAKNLADNGFFDAQHTLALNASGDTCVIHNKTELEAVISKEFGKITDDPDLKQKFAAIQKLLEKNVTVRDFQTYICDNVQLVPRLSNIAKFKEDIWRSYFWTHRSAFDDVINKYNKVKAQKKEIEDAARKEQTQWEKAIALFNERFVVPFRLEAKNKAEVMLGAQSVLDLGYTYDDGQDSAPVERQDLLNVLSQGEKKALYILNIIFEVEVRIKNGIETLFVVDDIADSFDYKNKYAIIQYLSDISDGAQFKQVILTHNFDFFRTINSRFVDYKACLMASKGKTGITLDQAAGIKNVFINDWKGEFFTDNRKRIACIPFMRNLIEYTRGDKDPDYIVLTSLLHWKTDSTTITQKKLDEIYEGLFGKQATAYADPAGIVVDLINKEAAGCKSGTSAANFDNKIVLSIGIRLAAEKFMSTKIGNATFLASIKEKQTWKLLDQYIKTHSGEAENIKVLRNVALMTPENIHLNAFMYEPILDMSDDHLRKLFKDVSALK